MHHEEKNCYKSSASINNLDSEVKVITDRDHASVKTGVTCMNAKSYVEVT
jgi:hypothetical protein